MSELIDRVALAFTGLHITTADGSVVAAEDVARAAVYAMREPTFGMCEAPTHYNGSAKDEEAISNTWKAMIDAALHPTDTITDTAGNITGEDTK